MSSRARCSAQHSSVAFVEIAEGVEGLCHISEAVNEQGKQTTLEVGSEHEFKIVKMSPEEKKVGLSLRGIGEEASREEVEHYKAPTPGSSSSSSSSSSSTTLGEPAQLEALRAIKRYQRNAEGPPQGWPFSFLCCGVAWKNWSAMAHS